MLTSLVSIETRMKCTVIMKKTNKITLEIKKKISRRKRMTTTKKKMGSTLHNRRCSLVRWALTVTMKKRRRRNNLTMEKTRKTR